MAIRKKQTGKEDLRQRRSKRYLSDALLSLMDERPLSDISVVDICERAMVHRTTFYAHFEDKMDLFRYVLEEMIHTAVQGRDAETEKTDLYTGVTQETQQALEFLQRHKRFYLSGLAGGLSPEVRMLEDAAADAIVKTALAERPELDPVNARLVGAFYAGGVLAVLRWWLENDMPLGEGELLALLKQMLPRYDNVFK